MDIKFQPYIIADKKHGKRFYSNGTVTEKTQTENKMTEISYNNTISYPLNKFSLKEKIVSTILDIFHNNNDYPHEYNLKQKITSLLNEFSSQDFNYETYTQPMSEEHIGFYWYAFGLTLYFLNKLDNIPQSRKITKYRYIMNEICNIGGDTDTNCAIVGCVIGPLLGYTNFGSDLNTFLNAVSEERFMYSSTMMFYYVKFLEETKLNNKKQAVSVFAHSLLLFLYVK